MTYSFITDTATTELYTLSLHDALPIWHLGATRWRGHADAHHLRRSDIWSRTQSRRRPSDRDGDRKSTRLNSSHVKISYAVFCLKKKKQKLQTNICTEHQQNL